MATKQQKQETIEIAAITKESFDVCILGMTPLLCNAMSNKVKQGLLLPAEKKTAATKASTLKHNPLEEYRSSVYRSPGGENERK